MAKRKRAPSRRTLLRLPPPRLWPFTSNAKCRRGGPSILGSILIPLNGDYRISLRRAPDVQAACTQAWGPADGTARVIALRELQGIVSAYEWRKNGVQIPALQTLGGYDRIHPHYGVFSPVRGEYVDLVAQAPLPATATHKAAVAWDIGTGTGVLAAVLARRACPR